MHSFFQELKKEHDTIKECLKELSDHESKKREGKSDLLKKLKSELVPHSRAEEIVLYDLLRDHDHDAEVLGLEGYVEHGVVDRLLELMEEGENDSADFEAELGVLKELLHHHIEEEEDEIFKKAEALLPSEQLDAMEEQFLLLREEFRESMPTQEEAGEIEGEEERLMPPPSFVSFR